MARVRFFFQIRTRSSSEASEEDRQEAQKGSEQRPKLLRESTRLLAQHHLTISGPFLMRFGPFLEPFSALLRGSEFGRRNAPGPFVDRFASPWKFHPDTFRGSNL